MDRPRFRDSRLVLAFAAGLLVSCVVIFTVVTHRPLNEGDFELVEASPQSVVVLRSQRKPFVEIRIPDDPLRYRIPVERFEDYQNPSEFLQAASRAGARLSFHIERGARQDPELPRADPKPTVFVQSMRVGSKTYYSLAERIHWDERNIGWARILAVGFPLFTAYLGVQIFRRRR